MRGGRIVSMPGLDTTLISFAAFKKKCVVGKGWKEGSKQAS